MTHYLSFLYMTVLFPWYQSMLLLTKDRLDLWPVRQYPFLWTDSKYRRLSDTQIQACGHHLRLFKLFITLTAEKRQQNETSNRDCNDNSDVLNVLFIQ